MITVHKDEELPIWFNQFLTDLVIRVDTRYPNSTFYDKDNETLFELYVRKNDENRYLYVNYDKIWGVIHEMFGTIYGDCQDNESIVTKVISTYNDTQSFIKNHVEKSLGLTNVMPYNGRWRGIPIEDIYKDYTKTIEPPTIPYNGGWLGFDMSIKW